MSKLHTIKAIALAASIVIVLNLFINMGVKTFYPGPEFEDFCSEVEGKVFNNQTSCEAVGGNWVLVGESIDGRFERPVPFGVEDRKPYCDPYKSCRADHQDARSLYDRNVFIILIIAGLVSLGVGYGISAAAAVSSGLVFGGVLSFIIGTMRYWSNMDDYLRFIVLGLALVVLIWIGYRKVSGKNS